MRRCPHRAVSPTRASIAGFCVTGCSTNAKQSVLVTFLPRALAAGAEIRDLAMVGRVETNEHGMATGVHYHRAGEWRFQRARNVVVAGYAIETPRLLLNSANDRFPDGLANSSGLVGKYLMAQSNQAVWGVSDDEIRSYKGPPSLAMTEHWNYDDNKDFFGGYCYMSQGPLAAALGQYQSRRQRPVGRAPGPRDDPLQSLGRPSRWWAKCCRRSGTG